jgi:septum formation inhibitor-activating ATPase MinD
MGVSHREVEDALGQSVFQTLERDDDAVIRSMNLGQPAVLAGRSRFARGMTRLGREIAGEDRVAEESGGLFGALMRPFRPSR